MKCFLFSILFSFNLFLFCPISNTSFLLCTSCWLLLKKAHTYTNHFHVYFDVVFIVLSYFYNYLCTSVCLHMYVVFLPWPCFRFAVNDRTNVSVNVEHVNRQTAVKLAQDIKNMLRGDSLVLNIFHEYQLHSCMHMMYKYTNMYKFSKFYLVFYLI